MNAIVLLWWTRDLYVVVALSRLADEYVEFLRLADLRAHYATLYTHDRSRAQCCAPVTVTVVVVRSPP